MQPRMILFRMGIQKHSLLRFCRLRNCMTPILFICFILGGEKVDAGVTGGIGAGSLILVGREAMPTLSLPTYVSLTSSIDQQTTFLLDFEGTPSIKSQTLGLAFYIGGQIQRRFARLHLGFGPGILLGGWLFLPREDCEEDYSCIPAVAGIAGFALSGEIGYTFTEKKERRFALILRGVANPTEVTHGAQIFQIYLGLRIY